MLIYFNIHLAPRVEKGKALARLLWFIANLLTADLKSVCRDLKCGDHHRMCRLETMVIYLYVCRQLKRIENVQNVLGDMDAMKKVLPIMARTGDDIVREVLSFLACILFNGNEQVQVSSMFLCCFDVIMLIYLC